MTLELERFDSEAQSLITAAVAEAEARGNVHWDGKHILLAIARAPDSSAYRLLTELGADPTAIIRVIDSAKRPPRADTTPPDGPRPGEKPSPTVRMEYLIQATTDKLPTGGTAGARELLASLAEPSNHIASVVLQDFGVSPQALLG